MVLSSIFVLFCCFIYNSYSNILFLAIAIFIMLMQLLFGDDQSLFLNMSLLVPNIMMIKVLDHQQAILSYYILAVCVKYFFKHGFTANPFYFIHFAFVLITCFIYFDTSLLFSSFRTLIFLMYISALLSRTDIVVKKKTTIMGLFVLGVFLNCVFGLGYYFILGRELYNPFYFFSGIRNDRNYFACMISFGISISLVLLTEIKKISHVLLVFFAIAVMVFCGLTTLSRTFIVSIIPAVLMIFLLIFSKKSWKIGIVFMFSSALIILAFKESLFESLERVLERFNTDDVVTGNGRTDLWIYYLKLTMSNPIRFLVGNGPATQYLNSLTIDGSIAQHVEHNTFVQLFSNLGLLGTLSLILCFFETYRTVFNSNKSLKLYYLCPMLCGIIFLSTINCLYSSQFDYIILLSLITLASPVVPEKKDNLRYACRKQIWTQL